MNNNPNKPTLAERFKALTPQAKQQALQALTQVKKEREMEALKKKSISNLLEKQSLKKKM